MATAIISFSIAIVFGIGVAVTIFRAKSFADWFDTSCLVLILIVTLLPAMGMGGALAENSISNGQYPISGVVIHTSFETDTVTIEDCDGNLWQFKNADGWEIGDIAACIMDNNGTPINTDDEIILARRCGHMEGETE